MYLRQSETEIMDALWKSQHPMSSATLLEAIPKRKWKERSIFAIIDGLLKKGLIYEAGFVHRNKTIARIFAPTMTYSEFIVRQISDASSPYRPSIPSLVSAFIDADGVNEETLAELETLINEQKAKLKND